MVKVEVEDKDKNYQEYDCEDVEDSNEVHSKNKQFKCIECSYQTKYSFSWNAMDVGPKRDLVGMKLLMNLNK